MAELYRPVQQHAASVIEHSDACTCSELPPLIKDEFDTYLEFGNLAHGPRPTAAVLRRLPP